MKSPFKIEIMRRTYNNSNNSSRPNSLQDKTRKRMDNNNKKMRMSGKVLINPALRASRLRFIQLISDAIPREKLCLDHLLLMNEDEIENQY